MALCVHGSPAAYMKEVGQQGYKPPTIDKHRRILCSFYAKLRPPPQATVRFEPTQDSDRPAVSPDALQSLW